MGPINWPRIAEDLRLQRWSFRRIAEHLSAMYGLRLTYMQVNYRLNSLMRERIKANAKRDKRQKSAERQRIRFAFWREVCPTFVGNKTKRQHLRQFIRRTGGGLIEYAIHGVLTPKDLMYFTEADREEFRCKITLYRQTRLQSGSTGPASQSAFRLSRERNAAISSPRRQTSKASATSSSSSGSATVGSAPSAPPAPQPSNSSTPSATN